MLEIIIATSNSGKVKELRELLDNIPVSLVGLNKFIVEDVEETGATFQENADLKATLYAKQTSGWTIADDSGLEVFALNGAPGVWSARYSGIGSSDQENYEKLLTELAQTGDKQRLARFVCTVSISNPRGEIQFRSQGFCNGSISHGPKGSNGFGYDPVFIPEGFYKTFGELDEAVKHKLSHRAKALKKIIEYLRDIPLP